MIKTVFFGKILGFYYELNPDNTTINKQSPVCPASTVKWFKENTKKAYKGYKIVFNKIG